MTNSEIEKRANDMLAKYVQRGGAYKAWDKIMTGENIKYRQITTSPDFVGALTKGNNGQSYIMTNAAISNENGPAIYVRSADKVFITAAEGTVNVISDGSDYTLTDDEPSIVHKRGV